MPQMPGNSDFEPIGNAVDNSDNKARRAVTAGVTAVTRHASGRRDGRHGARRDGARSPISTGNFENRLPETNGSRQIRKPLYRSDFLRPSRRPTPQKCAKYGGDLAVLSGRVTPGNALGRRYRIQPTPHASTSGNGGPVTLAVTPRGAPPLPADPTVLHRFDQRGPAGAFARLATAPSTAAGADR